MLVFQQEINGVPTGNLALQPCLCLAKYKLEQLFTLMSSHPALRIYAKGLFRKLKYATKLQHDGKVFKNYQLLVHHDNIDSELTNGVTWKIQLCPTAMEKNKRWHIYERDQ